jgi:hypothetical protein
LQNSSLHGRRSVHVLGQVATESPQPWSLDGEPQPEEDVSAFRFSLLPRAVALHLPDDRMLVAGLQEADWAAEEQGKAGHRGRSRRGKGKAVRIPAGRLKPPSLADMMGRVVGAGSTFCCTQQ